MVDNEGSGHLRHREMVIASRVVHEPDMLIIVDESWTDVINGLRTITDRGERLVLDKVVEGFHVEAGDV